MSRGVQIGLRDVHFARLLTDVVGVGVTYAAPVPIIGAITANINPNASTETLFADDGPMQVATALGKIELELNIAELPLGIQATLLGHAAMVAGEIVLNANDVPPFVALGFRSLKSNGNHRFVWLLKGRFVVPEQSHETRADSITFSTPTIMGSFVKRDFDDRYQIIGDEDEVGFVRTGWFTAARIAAPRV
ncbi:MAG: hypothetical protein DDT19_01868 [Syntrophomonadaceae bacterium]|nr:hypothetical protein [Bacillota bacterium]